MDWSNDLILRFISNYKQYAIIWDPNHPEHKNKSCVMEAWEKVRQDMGTEVTVADLKRKKDALMATYRNLEKKVQIAKETGENYKPSWFCYNLMNNFLHNIYKPRSLQESYEVAAIFGIAGACRRDELQKISIEDIEDKGSALSVQIPESKSNKPRIFTIGGKSELNLLDYYRKYILLRPTHVQSNRLFVHYSKGKCSEKVVGVNAIANIPSEIATYLKLENPSIYTGHSFRASSSVFTDVEANILCTATDELAMIFKEELLENMDLTNIRGLTRLKFAGIYPLESFGP